MNNSMCRHHKIEFEVTHPARYDYTIDIEFDFFPLSYDHDDLVAITRITRAVRSAPDGYDYEEVRLEDLDTDDKAQIYKDAVAEGVVELAKELNKLKGKP